MKDMDELLRSSGLKITNQRRAILSILEQNELPASADEVYNALRERHISVNLSTVYRTMERMSECGLIKKLKIINEEKSYYEFFKVMHRHFLICLNCKKMIPIQGCPLKGYEKALEEKTDYKIAGHRLDIYGYCPECNSDI